MEATTPTQPKKRGRPKGSAKIKEEREATTAAAAAANRGGVRMRERGADKKVAVDEKYAHWKTVVPIIYDWFANHNLVWPSLSCRWGPLLEQGRTKNKQRLYLSEQTDGSVPNTLVIANCEVVKPRVAAADHIAHFNEDSRSPFVKKYKTIIHPGEVNRIRELPQNKNIIATHTDCPEVLIWDIEAQPNRHAVLGAAESRPDLVLAGHEDNAEYALAMCPTEPFVLSGGKDKTVVLWNIHDHISTLAGDASKSTDTARSIVKSADNSSVGPRGIFLGHEDTVEDVQFCPSSPQEFCSVGDDSCLILWDARVGSSPVIKGGSISGGKGGISTVGCREKALRRTDEWPQVENAHNADVHCVDWNHHDVNLILTGSADHSVCMFDRRSLTSGGVASPIQKFEDHKAPVLCVQWCPDRSSVFGSSAEDGFLNIWDHTTVGKKKELGTRSPNAPPGLFFKHCGHRDKVVDFHWNSSDPWTIVSVSDDVETPNGGGTLQIWRMNDLLFRPAEEVLAELQQFKSHVEDCGPRT